MSMLAEKKCRKKWIPNPQGNFWSKDSSKFGQKLLEKMGWSPGQGLGVQNQGRSEVLRVQYKNNNAGLGFNENDQYQIKHQSTFNNFLSSLTEQGLQTDGVITPVGIETKPTSLEMKSRNSRNRIHYHKYTRGKDMTQYSENDLAAILEISNIITNETNNVEEEIKIKNEINCGSMEDYFKKKQLKIKNKDPIQNYSSINENGEPVEEMTDYAFLDFSNSQVNDKVLFNDTDETNKTYLEVVNEHSKVKKKKKLRNHEISGIVIEDMSSEILGRKDNSFREKNISKNIGEEYMMKNCQDVLSSQENTTKKEKMKVKKHNENITVSESNLKRKNKSKAKSPEENMIDDHIQAIEYPKKKKKRKLENMIEESNETNNSDISTNSITTRTNLNKKKNKNSNLEVGNADEIYINKLIGNGTIEQKKKSKIKNKKSSNITSDIDMCQEHNVNIFREMPLPSVGNNFIVSGKNQEKKKSKRKCITDIESNVIAEENLEVFPPDFQEFPVEYKTSESRKVKKPLRKSKSKEEIKIIEEVISVTPTNNKKNKNKKKLKIKKIFEENSECLEDCKTVQDEKNVIVQKEIIRIQNSEEMVSQQSDQNFESIKRRNVPSSVKQYFKKYNLLVSKPELGFNGSNIDQIKGYGKLLT